MAMKVGELVPQIVNHPEFGDVRVIDNNGEPWFVGKDAAEKLGYKDTFAALKQHVDDEDKLVWQITSAGQKRNVTLINEGGLYSLTVRSNMPKAKEFTRWLTHDVAISIRKYGFYATPEKVEEIVRNPEVFIEHLITAYQRVKSERDELQMQLADAKPKADYCALILQSAEALPVTVIAKDYGMAAADFNKLLNKLKIQYKVGKTWVLYQLYAGLGYMKSVTKTLSDTLSVTYNYWTQKGRMFLYSTLKKCGILPIIERDDPQMSLM